MSEKSPISIQELFPFESDFHLSTIAVDIAVTASILQSLVQDGTIPPLTQIPQAAAIGCGHGYELWVFRQLGIKYVIGVDDQSLANINPIFSFRQELLEKGTNMSFEEEEFGSWLTRQADSSFPLMYAHNTCAGYFYHTDWRQVARVLTPGGIFIIEGDEKPESSQLTSASLTNSLGRIDYNISLPEPIQNIERNQTPIAQMRNYGGTLFNVWLVQKPLTPHR